MDKMTRLRASFRSSTRRKKKKKEEDVMEDEDGMDVAYQEIELELRPNERYRPTDLRIHFSVPEAGIEVLSEAPSPWEPSMKSSLNGASVWVPPFSIKVPWTEHLDAFFLLEDFKKKKAKVPR
ncbi:unnamed protein product [Lepeophtheirus salmonis]|uniref:(salmon louse) hypothetical protein n=1 Tax=Lepeophtheirus salmonis TaxID=72036 RepID=A0A7R8H1H4_LEPSM|nr:unnamed protein product [Lepeophtheirus salmonis]CAF2809538.1 unnamed protein product [Lepeophtheirus salmonis]